MPEVPEDESASEGYATPVRTDTTVLVVSGAIVIALGALFHSGPAQVAGVVAFLLGCVSHATARAHETNQPAPPPDAPPEDG